MNRTGKELFAKNAKITDIFENDGITYARVCLEFGRKKYWYVNIPEECIRSLAESLSRGEAASESKRKLERYVQFGNQMRDGYRKLEQARKARKAAGGERDRSEKLLEQAEKEYSRRKKEEAVYLERISVYAGVFDGIRDDLICLAGCTSAQSYEELLASISNSMRNLKYRMKKNGELLSRMTAVTEPEPYREPEEEESSAYERSMEEGPVPPIIKEMETLLRESRDAAQWEDSEIRALLEEWSRFATKENKEELRRMKEERDQLQKETEEDEKITAKNLERREQYLAEARRTAAYLQLREKDWVYFRLLQIMKPVMEQISRTEDVPDQATALSLGLQIRKGIEVFNEESRKYKFRWISHDSLECRESERIRVDFIPGEASWPGLYLYSVREPEKLLCVSPGHILTL